MRSSGIAVLPMNNDITDGPGSSWKVNTRTAYACEAAPLQMSKGAVLAGPDRPWQALAGPGRPWQALAGPGRPC